LGGSLPGTTPAEAITMALDILGPNIQYMPGGEIGRPDWAASIAQELAQQTTHFQPAKAGGWTDYDDMPQLAPLGDLSAVDLGYYRHYQDESPIIAQLARERRLALSVQVGIASPFDLAMIALGPTRHFRQVKPLIKATVREMTNIYTADETVCFQIEAPYELCGALAVPQIARTLATRKLVRKVIDLVRECPQGMRFGIHPCLGDFHHKAKGKLPQLTPLVDWVNELIDQWPGGYTLAYVHLPLAEGYRPPVTEPSWYVDLARLRVPAGVRVILGCCHERVTTSDLHPVVSMADTLLHRTVDVGASCGLALRGKRTVEDVYTVLHQQAELCRY
jgi:hypothetical protein